MSTKIIENMDGETAAGIINDERLNKLALTTFTSGNLISAGTNNNAEDSGVPTASLPQIQGVFATGDIPVKGSGSTFISSEKKINDSVILADDDALVPTQNIVKDYIDDIVGIGQFTGEIENTASIFDSGAFEIVDGALEQENYSGNTVVSSSLLGDVTTSVTSDDNGTLIDINTDGTWELLDAYDATNQTFSIVTGNKYFLHGKLIAGTGKLQNTVSLRYSDATIDSVGDTTDVDEAYGIITATKTLLANMKLTEGTAGTVNRAYQGLFPMSDMYYENYTSAQMLELVKNGYIDGIQGPGDKKITSRSKNKVCKSILEIGAISPTTGEDSVNINYIRPSKQIQIDNSSDITMSLIAGYAITNIFRYDYKRTFISQTTLGGTNEETVTSSIIGANTKYVRFLVRRTIIAPLDDADIANIMNSFQLEKGAIATAYEPFKSDSNYIKGGNHLLTVFDTYEDGLWTQNISSKTAIATATAVNTTNFPLAKLNGEYVLRLITGEIIVGIVDGSYTTTDTGYIIYELDTPIATIQKQSNMTAYKDGDFIVENKFTHIEYYGDGIDLASYGYTALTIVSAYLITPTSNIDGYQVLDVADFVVTGTVITNPNLSDIDLVFLEPEYADGRTQVTTTYNYPMNVSGTVSTTVQKVSENGKNINLNSKEIDHLQGEIQKAIDLAVTNLYLPIPEALIITAGTPISPTTFSPTVSNNFIYTAGSLIYDGEYDILCKVDGAVSMTSGTNNVVVTISFGKNGTNDTKTSIDRRIGTGSDVGAAPVAGVFEITKGDSLDFFIDVDISSTITIEKANFTIHELTKIPLY